MHLLSQPLAAFNTVAMLDQIVENVWQGQHGEEDSKSTKVIHQDVTFKTNLLEGKCQRLGCLRIRTEELWV